MTEHRRRSISQSLVLDLLAGQLAELRPDPAGLHVVDVGGGTGIVATALAGRGYRVTVIDPSPDALASLERRSHERGVADLVDGIQGDTSELATLAGPGSVDVVICHRVLDVVDSPADALAAIAAVLRPGGLLSLLVAQRHAAVLAQGLAGHFQAARRTSVDPRRFTEQVVVDLIGGAGLEVEQRHGIGAIADHVAESLVDSDPGAHAELLALEKQISQDPVFRAVAAQLHVLARQPSSAVRKQ